MNSVAFATRRLWLRRSRRTWFAVAKVFGALVYVLPPMWLFWFYRAYIRSFKNTSGDMFWLGTILQVIVGGVVCIVAWHAHLGRDATVDELRKARVADSCFDDTIVRRAALWKRPVTVRDVRNTQDDCAEMWDDIERQKAQAAALKTQLEK